MGNVKNARIESSMLGIEDHGILTFMLHLDYGGSGQGFGGYCMDAPLKKQDGTFIRRVGTAQGCDLILRVLEVVGVCKWEDLPGQHIRVVADHCKVHKIGHILKDRWLDIEEHYNSFKQEGGDDGKA